MPKWKISPRIFFYKTPTIDFIEPRRRWITRGDEHAHGGARKERAARASEMRHLREQVYIFVAV